MSKHTPGPWSVNTAGTSSPWPENYKVTEVYVYAPDTQDDVAICADVIDPLTQEPSKANAHLIAASPDLLAALKALVQQVERGDFDHIGADHPDSAVGAARAAIEKAEVPA
jgi:hypothetical protein